MSVKLIQTQNILMLIISTILSMLSWFFLGKLYPNIPSILNTYKMDFLSYLLIGITFNSLINVASVTPMALTMEIYHSDKFKKLFMTKTDPLRYLIIATIGFGITESALVSFAYFLIAFTVFGLQMPNLPLFLQSLLLIMVSFISVIAFELIIESLIFFSASMRVSKNPISLIIRLLTDVTSGIYYPVEILPNWLGWLSFVLPKSNALILARYIMINEIIFSRLFILIIETVILPPLAYFLFKKGVDKVRREGFIYSPLT